MTTFNSSDMLLNFKESTLVIGFALSYLGFSLFRTQLHSKAIHAKTGRVEARLPRYGTFKFINAAPGVFFTAMGCVIMTSSIIRGIDIKEAELTLQPNHDVKSNSIILAVVTPLQPIPEFKAKIQKVHEKKPDVKTNGQIVSIKGNSIQRPYTTTYNISFPTPHLLLDSTKNLFFKSLHLQGYNVSTTNELDRKMLRSRVDF